MCGALYCVLGSLFSVLQASETCFFQEMSYGEEEPKTIMKILNLEAHSTVFASTVLRPSTTLRDRVRGVRRFSSIARASRSTRQLGQHALVRPRAKSHPPLISGSASIASTVLIRRGATRTSIRDPFPPQRWLEKACVCSVENCYWEEGVKTTSATLEKKQKTHGREQPFSSGHNTLGVHTPMINWKVIPHWYGKHQQSFFLVFEFGTQMRRRSRKRNLPTNS